MLKPFAKRLPVLGPILVDRDNVHRDLDECGPVPPGQFYSPIPPWDEIWRDAATIWGDIPRSVPGIDMCEAEQLELLEGFAPYYKSMPFQPEKTEGLRYHFENPAYSYSDAICLHCLIRHARPKRISEVGSGYSSCVTLDTNEAFFDNSIGLTFVEPNPSLLTSLLKEGDEGRMRIIPEALQKVGLDVFRELEANDILFVDSTHVSK